MKNSKAILNAVSNGLKKHGPKIAAGVGGVLLVVGGYLLGKEVPRYKEALEKAKENAEGELSKKEKAKIFAKHFVTPICVTAGGALCLGASVIENERRMRQLAASSTFAAVSEMATMRKLSDYKDAVKEVIGEDKATEIKEKVKEIEEKREEVDLSFPQCAPEPGMMWCRDERFGGYFQTTVAILESAENEIARWLNSAGVGETACLNDAYKLINHEMIGAGDDLGWIFTQNIKGLKLVDLGIGSDIKNGQAILTINPKVVLLDDMKYQPEKPIKWR